MNQSKSQPFITNVSSLMPFMALFFIITKEAYKMLFFDRLPAAGILENKLIILWLALQVIFSITFGTISDRFCRKKTLTLTLGASLLSVFLIRNDFFLLAIIIDGIFCNVIPIARAAYCDVHALNNRSPNIINTILVQPISWIIFPLFLRYRPDLSFYTIYALGIFSFIFCLFFFHDLRDKKHRVLHQLNQIRKKFLKRIFIKMLLAYLVADLGWNIILYLFEENLQHNLLDNYLLLYPGVAFFIGALFSRIYNFNAKQALSLLFVGIFLFTALDTLFTLLTKDSSGLLSNIFLHYTLLGGVIIPMIFVFFGERASLHEQGTIYGVLESFQSLAEILGPSILGLLIFRKDANQLITLTILISTLIAAILSFKIYWETIKKAYIKERN
jgi:hypothetical protein